VRAPAASRLRPRFLPLGIAAAPGIHDVAAASQASSVRAGLPESGGEIVRRSALVTVMLLTLAGAAWGQDPEKRPATPARPEPAGPPLTPTGTWSPGNLELGPGDKVPAFQLGSSLGGTVGQADLKGHWSVLLFEENRMNLASLRATADSMRALGAQPYGVCPDGVPALRTLAERERIGFPLLSDLTREISQLFGMYDDRNQAIQPGIVIVDARGIVRMTLQGPSLHADEVLQMVKHVVRGD
jgi:peroxiredoxin